MFESYGRYLLVAGPISGKMSLAVRAWPGESMGNKEATFELHDVFSRAFAHQNGCMPVVLASTCLTHRRYDSHNQVGKRQLAQGPVPLDTAGLEAGLCYKASRNGDWCRLRRRAPRTYGSAVGKPPANWLTHTRRTACISHRCCAAHARKPIRPLFASSCKCSRRCRKAPTCFMARESRAPPNKHLLVAEVRLTNLLISFVDLMPAEGFE
jgi:hypothetical protein